MIRLLFAFVATALATGALTFGLSTLDASPLPVLTLFLIVGFSLSRIKSLEAILPSALTSYAFMFVFAFVLSLPESPSPRLAAARLGVLGLLGCATIFSLTVMGLNCRSKPKLVPWLFTALLMGAFVGFISGDSGGADPMRHFLMDYLPKQIAEAAVWTFRKSVHVGYYGFLAWTVFRLGKSAGTLSPWPALIFPLAHGCFDEYRQFALSRARYGTPVDILFDMAGIFMALFLAGAFRTSAPNVRKME